MEVNDQLIDRLADLARLHFSDTEKESIKTDLQNMLAMVDKISSVDTTDVEPLLHMTGNVSVMREDEVKGSISNEAALQNASRAAEGFFIVPKVINR